MSVGGRTAICRFQTTDISLSSGPSVVWFYWFSPQTPHSEFSALCVRALRLRSEYFHLVQPQYRLRC